MLISVIGTHCVGKSTLLNELKKNPNYLIDDFKVSRSVQRALGYKSLAEAISTRDNMIVFQEAILTAKHNNDLQLKLKHPNEIVFVERSFLDIIIYTKLWFNQLGFDYNDWLWDFERKALKFQRIYDGLILIEPHDDIPFELDLNRGSLETRNLFANNIKDSFTASSIPGFLIQEASLQTRIANVKQLIKSLK